MEYPLPLECLNRNLTVEEAEQEWMTSIPDDDTRIPRVPMGFVNKQWEEFKGHLTDKSELWTYTAHYGWLDASAGFAILDSDEKGKRVSHVFMDWIS